MLFTHERIVALKNDDLPLMDFNDF